MPTCTYRNVLLTFACLVILGGIGCNSPSTPPPRPGERLVTWLGERTPQEMRQVYLEGVRYLVSTKPTDPVYGKLSFISPQTASTTLELLTKFPEIKVTAIYAENSGESQVDMLTGTSLKAAFDKEYQDILWLTQRSIESQAEWCKEKPTICTPEIARRYTDALAKEQKKGQLTLIGLGIYGTPVSFKKLWDNTPEVFMILLQDGYIPGNPIYPDTNMKNWR